MANTADDIKKLESQFPALSSVAFDEARRRALSSGLSVMHSEHSAIYEVFPDGSRRHVKDIEPPTSVGSSHKITIR